MKKTFNLFLILSIILIIKSGCKKADTEIDKILIEAVKYANIEEVKKAIKKGADVNTKVLDGLTVLMHACVGGNLELVKYLVEKVANVKIIDKHSRTALKLASFLWPF